MASFPSTPGPWFRKAGRLYGRDGFSLVCESLVMHENWETREHCTNAHLIVAAPDLHEALQDILAWLIKAELEMGKPLSLGYQANVQKAVVMAKVAAALRKVEGA